MARQACVALLESGGKYLRDDVLHRNGRVTGLFGRRAAFQAECQDGMRRGAARRVSCLPLPNSAIFKWDCVRECNCSGKHGPWNVGTDMDREEPRGLTDRENQRRWGEGEKSDVDAQTAKRRRKENGSNSEVVEDDENFRNFGCTIVRWTAVGQWGACNR